MRALGRAAPSQVSNQSDARVLGKVLRGIAADEENAEFAAKLAPD